MEELYKVRKRLQELNEKRESLINIPERVEMLEIDFASLKATSTDGDGVHGGENLREEKMLANIAERDELRRKLRMAEMEVKQMERALGMLPDGEREVLERFYVARENGHVQRLCDELNCENAQVYRLKDKAMRSLARMLYASVEL